jgi:hypothetical protein
MFISSLISYQKLISKFLDSYIKICNPAAVTTNLVFVGFINWNNTAHYIRLFELLIKIFNI